MSILMESGAVVMAVYRPVPALLARQISSLRAQSVQDWKCVIGIDGRDPETLSLLRASVDGDARFEVIEFEENVGVYRHFERLLERVPKDVAWVSLADQDDYWYQDKFARLLPVLDRPCSSAVLGQARLVNDRGEVLGRTDRRPGDLAQTMLTNQVTGSLTVFRRSVVTAALPFPGATKIAIHDHWLGVCAAATGKIGLLDEVVQDYVQHGGNVLGEAQHITLRGASREIVDRGGPRSELDYIANELWGWRVNMAEALLTRAVGSATPTVAAFARGTLTLRVLRALLTDVCSRRVRPIAAVGMIAAELWWPFRSVSRNNVPGHHN